MRTRAVSFTCDTTDCGAYCQIEAPTVEAAAEIAKARYGWSEKDGEDFCGPCTRAGAHERKGTAGG